MTEFPPCPWCHGNGYIKDKEQTNEQWFCSLHTNEKAKWIANEINERVKLALHDSELNDGDIDVDFYMEDSGDWKEWLKQPYREE